MSSLTNFRWSGLSKSNLRIGPFKRLGMVQSMPMLSTNPKVLKVAVKRAVPAKTSNAKTWLICRPTVDWPLVKLSSSQRCSCREWGLKHPGSAHTWRPLEQLSPGFAALQPLGRLKPQQILCFWGVSKALLSSPAGMNGPRCFPFLPLAPPFGSDLGWRTGLRDRFFVPGGFSFGEATFAAAPAKGSRWKAMVGCPSMFGNEWSIGSLFVASLLSDVMRSERKMKAALSALRTCWIVIGE